MNRIVVVGRTGAGKTALAQELSDRTGTPVIHHSRWERADMGVFLGCR